MSISRKTSQREPDYVLIIVRHPDGTELSAKLSMDRFGFVVTGQPRVPVPVVKRQVEVEDDDRGRR